MEYLPGGELFDYIAERQGLSEAESRKFFQQIAAAVGHCHKVRLFIFNASYDKHILKMNIVCYFLLLDISNKLRYSFVI